MNQNETVIQLQSLTHAMKAKKLLSEHGIGARVIKPDARRSEKGCGYGITIDRKQAEKTVLILKENRIPPIDLT